jgi:hypothetical protein
MSNIIKYGIVKSQEVNFGTQKKGLEDRIDEVKLSPEEEEAIVATKIEKTIRDKVLGLFKVGEIVNTILNWNEEVDKDIKEAKKGYLLSSYFNKTDQTENSVEKIKEFLTNPKGNTIFNKILRILDNTPPDTELTEHLATVLKHIINTDFNSLFEEHKFALNQIEMLTPQALSLLADHKNWKPWQLKSYSSANGKITSDWLPDFVYVYAASKGITDTDIKARILHSMNDLDKNRYAHASLTTTKLVAAVFLTDIGKLIAKYIE